MMNGGGIRKQKGLIAPIEEVPFLPVGAKENWEESLPKIWSGETVWPESAIKALRYMKQEALIETIDFEYAIANFMFFHPSYWRFGWSVARNKVRLLRLLSHMGMMKIWRKAGKIIFKRSLQAQKIYLEKRQLEDIIQCHDFLMALKPEFKLQN